MAICKLLFVVNEARFFISHRLAIAVAAKAAGYEVHVATPEGPGSEEIESQFQFHPIPLNRKGVKPVGELSTMLALYRLYRKISPTLVHHVTIKPVLYGGLMGRLVKVPAVVSAITGLGFVFINSGLRAKILRWAIKLFYRCALDHPNSRAIFQNPDDRELFVHSGLLPKNRSTLIRGSGVDMRQFTPSPEPCGAPLVVLAARMIWDKGVGEFVKAAYQLRLSGVQARFVLVGEIDYGNPSAIPEAQMKAWQAEGFVEWWGYKTEMPEILSRAHIVCLPSYREGVPKVLIEAAACGRATIATDMPGCREIVRHEENGLLVPPRDASALAAAIERLVEDPALRTRFGARGRQIAEAEFSVERVVRDTLAIYRELLQ